MMHAYSIWCIVNTRAGIFGKKLPFSNSIGKPLDQTNSIGYDCSYDLEINQSFNLEINACALLCIRVCFAIGLISRYGSITLFK